MVDFSLIKDAKKVYEDGDDAYKVGSFLNDLSDVDVDGIPEIPTFSGENKWLTTGSDLINTATTCAELIACPEDPMLWIQAGIDLVKDVGDIFKDIFGGSDDEEEEKEEEESDSLESALNSKELGNL